MWKISNYSLNYADKIAAGEMDIFGFLAICRSLDLDGASLHLQNLPSTEREYLARVRRALLDHSLSLGMFTVTTNFGKPAGEQAAEMAKARQAIRAAAFLGAPVLRVFAGSPESEGDRAAAFNRAADAIRQTCVEAAEVGLPVGLQNHNHGALCRTGDEILKMIRQVDHANLVLVLDTGQYAGSPGASTAAEQIENDYLDSLRKTAALARHVRVKFYEPRADGSDSALDYEAIFDILRGVHYSGFLDIVYEGTRIGDHEDARTAVPRIAAFLQAQSAGGAPAKTIVPRANLAIEARYADLRNDRIFESREVETAADVAFLEGPAWDGGQRLFFSETRMERTLVWDMAAKKLSVFRDQTNATNGMAFDAKGRLLCCEGGAGRVTRIDVTTRDVETLCDSFEGKPLGSPNDVTLDAKGRIYFSSRFGAKLEEGQAHGIYRIDPDGKVERILASPKVDMPNGLVTSPDDSILYVIDADGTEGGARRIRAFELKVNGRLGREWTLYDFYPGRSGDGMRIDAEGNLYVAAGLHARRGSSETLDTRPGIHVISPEGKLLAFVVTPEDTITNCAFAGEDLKTLYIVCGKKLLSIRTKIPGKELYRVKR